MSAPAGSSGRAWAVDISSKGDTVNQPQASPSPAQTYEDYFVPHLFRPWTDELLQRARPQPGERVLDVACGTGIVARRVAQELKGQARVTGLDLSPAMIEVARATSVQEGVTIDWHVSGADALPFPDGSFDLVLIQQGVQFFPDRGAAAREAHRVLTAGGRLVTATWTEIHNNPFSQIYGESVARNLGQPAMHAPFSLGNRDELQDVLTTAGFTNVAIETVRRNVRFKGSEQFLDRFVAGGAAAVPALQKLDEGERSRLIAAVRADMTEPLQQFVEGDEVVFSLECHIAVAHKERRDP